MVGAICVRYPYRIHHSCISFRDFIGRDSMMYVIPLKIEGDRGGVSRVFVESRIFPPFFGSDAKGLLGGGKYGDDMVMGMMRTKDDGGMREVCQWMGSSVFVRSVQRFLRSGGRIHSSFSLMWILVSKEEGISTGEGQGTPLPIPTPL